jgi:hypothetical protein
MVISIPVALDSLSFRNKIRAVRFVRGASRGVLKRGRMRRLRVREDVSFTLGRSGVAVRLHYGRLPLLRGWTWCG